MKKKNKKERSIAILLGLDKSYKPFDIMESQKKSLSKLVVGDMRGKTLDEIENATANL